MELRVNGRAIDVEGAPTRLLSDVLRSDLGLTGTKVACDVGVCGACTVLIDERPASACLTLIAQVEGAEVTTIEAVADGGRLDALQESFVERGGLQCGICTPGQVMSARALLARHPDPDEETVRHWMAGNLCRCTGYYKIIEAVLEAARDSGRR